MFSRRAAAGVPGPRMSTPCRASPAKNRDAQTAAAGVSAVLDAGTSYGRIGDALKNNGGAEFDIRATTSHGDIVARSL